MAAKVVTTSFGFKNTFNENSFRDFYINKLDLKGSILNGFRTVFSHSYVF